MDEIYYLEPDEEITSVIDKIKNSKSNRISLVVPREAILLQSVVNLKLLVKEAAKFSKEIVLVTSDKIGRNLAAQVGLTVFDSIKSGRPIYQPPAVLPDEQEVIEIDMGKAEPAQAKPKGIQVHHFQEEASKGWSKKEIQPFVQPAWKLHKPAVEFDWEKTRKIIWPMIIATVLLVLIGLFLILPKVTIKIKVLAQNYEKTLEAKISADATSNLGENIYAGNLIDLSSEKEAKFTATGKKNLGGKASGTLTVYNYWDSNPQTFPTGTKFLSSSKTFVSKSSVTIPGTSIRGGNIVPGNVNVDIEAENAGEDYNVKSGRFTIVGLPAAQQEKIYGQSSKDLTGGFSKEVTVVSQQDYDQAKDKLTKELNDDLKNQLKEKTNGLEILDKAVQNDTVETKSSANVGQEANDFTLKIKERTRVMGFNKSDFDQFIVEVLEKQIPQDKMITLGLDDTIVPVVKETKYDEKSLNLEVHVKAKISSKVDIEKVKKDLLGKSNTAINGYLNKIDGINGFEIKFSPSWWLKRISNFQRNLKVELEYMNEETIPVAPSPDASSSLPATPASAEVLP